jgi:hypothetical protein
VIRSIDMVEKPSAVIDDLARIIAFNGRLAIIGVFLDNDPHAPLEPAKKASTRLRGVRYSKKASTSAWGATTTNATTTIYAT